MAKSASKGFSLIEVIAAFAIMALVAGALLPFATDSLRHTQASFSKARAASLARNKLEEILAMPGVPDDEVSRFNENFSYRIQISPKSHTSALGLALYSIEIEVFWGQRSLRLQTEKLVLEDGR